MTQYNESSWGSTDATYPSGQLTKRWVTTNETVVAANQDTGEPENDYTFEQEWSVTAERLNSWDAVEDGNELNIELVARFRSNESAQVDGPYGLVVRASGAAGSENGYIFRVEEFVSNNFGISIREASAGSVTTLGNSPTVALQVPVVSGGWIHMRVRINGTAPATLQAKIWRHGFQEPSSWHIELTDSTHTTAGWNGIFGETAGQNFETDYLGGGTNGDTAPLALDTANTVRLTAAYAQALIQDATPQVRLTAAYAQALHQVANPQVRLTAAYAQVLYTIATATPVDSDHAIPIEWGPQLNIDQTIPLEWTTELVIDRQIPIEWAGPLDADNAIPTEWTTQLDIDRQIPFEWGNAITPHDSQVPIEWRSGVAQNHQMPINWSGFSDSDHVIPYAWRGPFADPGADFQIPFDWKLELVIDRQSPVEWNTELDTDHVIPYEWLTETVLVSLHQIPINWAGFIDIDRVIPVEWTTELLIDRVIPVEWQLTVFLEIDRQIPVEWKLDVETDNSIPVEWFLQLQLDHQIPYSWQAPFSPVDFGIPVEWTLQLERDVSIPVEWHLDVLPSFAIPVEWNVDVGHDSTIPFDWVSPAIAADKIIPIEWLSELALDKVIPFEWLLETVIATDREIPIEWQQIFFKQFDHAIPWEVRGILDPVPPPMPIEWRGDPGFDAGIPVEWTDPLFALFVTRDEDDCEFWIADCNGVKWDAMCVASLWLADELPNEAQSAEEPGGTWVARDEEIGGTWFAAERQSVWEAPCLPAAWLANPPDVWYADECPAAWFAETQLARWHAAANGTRWIVLEPNPRGDIEC